MTLTVFDPRAGEPVTITVPAYRPSPTRLGANILLALGTVTLAQVMAPAAAQAQCNSSSKPAPPVVANFSNQSFGNNLPLVPYNVTSFGLGGCVGTNGGSGESGGPGSPGQSGGQINSTNSALTIIGGFSQNGPNTDSFGAPIVSRGGNGGSGGESGRVDNDDIKGGDGGAGGAGGNVTVSFVNGTFVPDKITGLATFGLVGASFGSQGGDGGINDPTFFGFFAKLAGDGGAGGSGGSVMLAADGTIRALESGVEVRSFGGAGGAGGDSNSEDKADTTQGGAGGNGGMGGTASLQWLSGTVQSNGFGLRATAGGGVGGNGGNAGSGDGPLGGDGGAGGNGGTANVLLSGGAITVTQTLGAVTGIYVDANGGDGGAGGKAASGIAADGGDGGTGGSGGTASATILGTVTLNGSAGVGQTSGQAVLVQANGGGGGQGGSSGSGIGQAGGGGFAGAGGSATLTLGSATTPGTLRTTGNFGHGAVVQSVGGGGGNGGSAGFFGTGGAGAAGGDGGQVTVNAPKASTVATSVFVTGTNSIALLAQSVGGGGGVGGDATGLAIGGGVAIGGNGGHGGNGGTVTLNLAESVFASTNTLGGAGVLAQSIGGSGGAGGSATLKGTGLFLLTIGGDAGTGGVGGPVNVSNSGLITSYGDHAAGVQAQSIGGGGGKGGAAVAFNVGSVIPTASVAVGGQGGDGGAGGNVSVINKGQVTTYGADAYGVNIHSIGGGGGNGGIAAARAVNISGDPDIPAISLSASIGGKGGSGNSAGTVGLGNSGLITTAGDGAIGVMAQSIGGGGGNGGDSTAASYSVGPQDTVAISLAVAVGGAAGPGGTGGAVTITNEGLVATLGQDAFGVFAQSVGGGGGTGGAGDASASANNAKSSFGASLAIGGTGGTGGDAGVVSLSNGGAITTQGDGADAVFAQSVGGGGGVAGGGVATANGGKLSIAVGVGGMGGAGGQGNTATVTNSGSIVTRGTDSIGISVQSIGGGGGKGGKGGATAGGTNPASNATSLFNILAGGLNFGQTVKHLGDGVLQIGQIGQEIQATFDELSGIFSQPQADPSKKNIGNSPNINVAVSVGGSGGAAGNGGAANATNTGSIATYGAQSDGIYAQSVGGGGGSGGAASSTDKAGNDTPVQASLAVGGQGRGGGSGGAVTVTNGTGGKILTQGVAAFGIFAQSVGGGGGEGSLAGTVDGSLQSLGVGIGGNGGVGGDGGVVTVTTGDGANGSAITTTGKHGIAIFAQSVGGGGGLVRTMTTDETFDPSKIIMNPQGRLADIHGLSLNIGGQSGSSGAGGDVNVFASGPITTSGLDAHAILAQSIGGGGGMAVGGQVVAAGGTGGGGGDGGTVKIELQPGAKISTSGPGAYGILAQSIGGGGGAGGDFSFVPGIYQLGTAGVLSPGSDNGGAVSIAANSTSVHTTGSYAPAIFAQSVGGGGGLLNYHTNDNGGLDVQARGTVGGNGTGGPVNITLVKSQVIADGVGSAGILAQSDGTATNPIVISIVDRTSLVQGGLTDPKFKSVDPNERDVAAIRLLGGTANKITNDGTIQGDATPSQGTAILANGSAGNTTVTNNGTISGNIILDGAGNVVSNLVGGVISAPTTLNLSGGVLQNAGTVHVGGIGTIGTTTLTGDLVQSSTGGVHIDIDPARGQTDQLQISGRATLDGAIVVNPISVHKGTSGPVITAAGGLTVTPNLQGTTGLVFTHTALVLGNSLSIATDADFKSNDLSKSANERGVAGHLQRIWDSGAPGFDQGFLNLSRLSSVGAYTQALDSLSGEVHASTAGVLVDESRYMRGAVLGRLRQASYGGYTGMAPLASGGPLASADGEELSALAYAKSPVVKAPLVAPAPTSDVVFWTQGFGGFGRFEGDGNAASVRRDLAGFITGVDTRVGESGRAGIAAGYIGSRNNLDGRGSANVETGNVAAYGGWSFGAVNLRAGGAYAFHTIDTARAVVFPGFFDRATARYDGGTGQIFGELGYGFAFGNVAVEPFAGGAWVRLDTDGAAERATTAGLNIAANSFEVPYSALGIRAASLIPISDGMVLMPRASAAWQHAFNSVTPAATLAFQLAPVMPFVIAGVPIARDSLLTEVGVDLAIGRNATLGLSYVGQIASNVQDHAAKGKFSWRF